MHIQVISFKCILKSRTGQLISSTVNRDVLASEPMAGVQLSGLSAAMQNLKPGEKRSIQLTAQEAYGFYDPKKVILFPRNKLPRHVKIGQTIQVVSKTGITRVYKVIEFHGSMVTLDENHPLAGQDLIFEIEVLSARNASEEEIAESHNEIGVQLLH